MGKTREHFKIIRDTKGKFHAKMCSIKNRNGPVMDLTEAEDIRKRWQEYTEKLYKKDLHDPDNHEGVITHLEPDFLECEVKWALGSITTDKASKIPVELFQILRDDAVKVLHSIWKTQQWHRTGKGQFSFQSLRKAIPKDAQITRQLHSSHTLVMLKILQARLQHYVNFLMFKLVLEKAEQPEIKLPTSVGSSKKQESSRKTSISTLLTMSKPLTTWITTNSGKFWKRWEYQTTWSASWEICMQVRKQQLELVMEQQTDSK